MDNCNSNPDDVETDIANQLYLPSTLAEFHEVVRRRSEVPGIAFLVTITNVHAALLGVIEQAADKTTFGMTDDKIIVGKLDLDGMSIDQLRGVLAETHAAIADMYVAMYRVIEAREVP